MVVKDVAKLNLFELQQEEKLLFDTYKSKRSLSEKAEHLEYMAKVIRQQVYYNQKR